MFGQIINAISAKEILVIKRDCNLDDQTDFGKKNLRYCAPEGQSLHQNSLSGSRRRQICRPACQKNSLFFALERNSLLHSCSWNGGKRLKAERSLNLAGEKALLVHKSKLKNHDNELLHWILMSRSSKTRFCICKMGMENNPDASVEQQTDLDCLSGGDINNHASFPGLNFNPLRDVGKSTNIVWQECMVKKEVREKHLRQKGCVVWITGLSGSGKSTLACTLDHALLKRGRLSYVLDGDNLRHGLNKNLGFNAEDRTENIRRVGEVAKLFADAGLICIASFISPYKKDRDGCRKLLPDGDFIEVYLKVPLELCEKRDAKGLYKLARAGKIKCFTGIDDPYEEPQSCEIIIEPVNGRLASPEEMAAQVLSFLEGKGYLEYTS